MSGLSDVLEMQEIMFLLMGTGFVLRKLNIIDGKGRAYLTTLLIDLILPCNIIHAFMIEMNGEILRATFWVLIIASVIQIFSWLLGKVIFFKAADSRRRVMQYATMCSNAGFMGNPVVEGIFGAQGLLYASIYLIPLRFFMWSAGLSCFTRTSLKDTLKKLAVHPCIIAVWIGFAVMLSQITLPSAISRTIGYISDCNLPVSIIVIGTILAEVSLKNIINFDSIWFCIVRLIILPLLVLVLCMALHMDTLVTGVCVTLTSMPAGSTTAILAEKYGGDYAYASEIILLSSVLSLASVPMFCMIITRLM